MALAAMDFRHARLDWSRVYIAGVLNVTPDSFSDGGLYRGVDSAVERGLELFAQGADLIDIGGESTRPGAAAVDEAEEIARVMPVIERLARVVRVPLSIDTTKAGVARAALAAGAEIVNDISGGLFDPDIITTARDAGAAYICGHVRGTSLAQVHAHDRAVALPTYEDVAFELAARVASLPVALRHRTLVDPGLGFGKPLPRNLELIRRAGELGRAVGCPVMLGPSRKRFVRALVQQAQRDGQPDAQPDAQPGGQRDGRTDALAVDSGTVGACLAAAGCGAHIVRTHNIELLKPALMVYEASTGTSS